MLGSYKFQCPKCKHEDSLRGEDHEPVTWSPTCTNPNCRYGYGEKHGMSVVEFVPDETVKTRKKSA